MLVYDEVIDFDEEKAKINLEENDWSNKMTDGVGDIDANNEG